MSKKKSKIAAIVLKTNVPKYVAVCFRVGALPTDTDKNIVEVMPIVKSISYSRHAYGQGAVVDEPCYFISFENSDEVLVVPASERAQVVIATDTGDEVHTPSLPE